MMPAIFVGHGNPMHAVEENDFTEAWRKLGEKLPQPEAVVVVSAHWETLGTFVTATENPRTIHDFFGFPQILFDVEYKAPGNPALASDIINETKEFGLKADENWGLDHGAWSVLQHMYPAADVPVLQISLDRLKTPRDHFKFAQSLKFLRERGVLVMASGNIVHNLRQINFRNPTGSGWAQTANDILKRLILKNDVESLIDYGKLGAEVAVAVPTPEHFLPLLYALALKTDDDETEIFNDRVELGSISMTSFVFAPSDVN